MDGSERVHAVLEEKIQEEKGGWAPPARFVCVREISGKERDWPEANAFDERDGTLKLYRTTSDVFAELVGLYRMWESARYKSSDNSIEKTPGVPL